MNAIKRIKGNLAELYKFHIVPGWRWSDVLWEKFRGAFPKITMCRDGFGNVYLNCRSIDNLVSKIDAGSALILQAHLDHPGAIVAGKVLEENGKSLYCGAWSGSYRYPLEGKSVSVFDIESGVSDECVIEMDARRFGERFIYFCSEAGFDGGATAHCTGSSPSVDETSGIISGWALDDALNSAILIDVFGEGAPENVIGLLTLDEERGSCGMEYFLRLAQQGCGARPVLINVEAPAENEEAGLPVGGGAKIRTADARAVFSKRLCDKLRKILPDMQAMPITHGGTEASLLAKAGWETAGLALPVRFAHNGSRDELWCEEEASVSDALEMHDALLRIIENAGKLVGRPKSGAQAERRAAPAIKIVDEATRHLLGIRKAKAYGDYLLNVAGGWHKAQSRYGVRFLPMSADEYGEFRTKLIEGKVRAPGSEKLRKIAKEALAELLKLTGLSPPGPLNIYLFLAANFNAKQINGGIGLSIDRIDWDDLPRILCHEGTHWLTLEILRTSFARAPVRGFISEGLACYISGKLLDLPPHRALNIEKKKYDLFWQKDRELKNFFLDTIAGRHVELKGKRHRILSTVNVWDPFTITEGSPYNKYGYHLGLNFFRRCDEMGVGIDRILRSPELVGRLISEYLAS